MAFPLRLQGRDVNNDATASIGRLAEANREYRSRNAKIFHRPCQSKGVRWDNTNIALHIDKTVGIKVLWIYDRRVSIGEDFEFVGAANIVAIGRSTVGYQLATFCIIPHLTRLKRLNHALVLGHTSDPFV